MKLTELLYESVNIEKFLDKELKRYEDPLIDKWAEWYIQVAEEIRDIAKEKGYTQLLQVLRDKDLAQKYGKRSPSVQTAASLLDTEFEFISGYKNQAKKIAKREVVEPVLVKFKNKIISKLSPLMKDLELIKFEILGNKLAMYKGGLIGDILVEFNNGLSFVMNASVRINYAPVSGYFFAQYPMTFKKVVFPDGKKKNSVSHKELVNYVMKLKFEPGGESPSSGLKLPPSWAKKLTIEDSQYVFKIPSAIVDLVKAGKGDYNWIIKNGDKQRAYYIFRAKSVDELKKLLKKLEELLSVAKKYAEEKGYYTGRLSGTYAAEAAKKHIKYLESVVHEISKTV